MNVTKATIDLATLTTALNTLIQWLTAPVDSEKGQAREELLVSAREHMKEDAGLLGVWCKDPKLTISDGYLRRVVAVNTADAANTLHTVALRVQEIKFASGYRLQHSWDSEEELQTAVYALAFLHPWFDPVKKEPVNVLGLKGPVELLGNPDLSSKEFRLEVLIG